MRYVTLLVAGLLVMANASMASADDMFQGVETLAQALSEETRR